MRSHAWWFIVSVAATLAGAALPRTRPEGVSVLPADALLTKPVGGLERTNASAEVVPVTGPAFTRALRVTIRGNAPDTNVTQLTMPIATAVGKGDAMLASFYVRGDSANRRDPAQIMFLFEKSVGPWTKSVAQGVTTARDPQVWRHVLVPFAAAESYRPGEAMVSLRFAFGPQTVEVGGLSVVDYDSSRTVEALVEQAAEQNRLGDARVAVHRGDTRQTIMGFGGDFTKPRYGAMAPLDPVARYNLDHLRVVHARIGIPLNFWTPQPGVYKDEGPAHAALLQMQYMARHHIPMVGSVWEGPLWMLPGKQEQESRTLPLERYGDCIEAIGRFLVTARDRYGATVDNFSFNEADYGVNFRFTPAQIDAFIRQAGPRWHAMGLKTRFLVGDTTSGAPFPAYARPLLEDRSIAAYLGPLAFHCWDALGAADARYAEIAAMGRRYHKPVWCTEAGHDAGLWQRPNPWGTWENALRTALAYAKTIGLTGASLMDYWTYEDDYPLTTSDGTNPYPVWRVMKQMEDALPPGSRITAADSDRDDLKVLASSGPGSRRFSLLLVNPVGAGRATVSGLPANMPVAILTSTAAAQSLRTRPRTDRSGRLSVLLPARSVVTVLGS